MYVSLTAAVVGLVLSIVSFFARKERSTYANGTNVFKMQKALVYTCICISVAMLSLAIYLAVQAIYFAGTHGKDAGPPACVGTVAAFCALIWSLYEVRLEKEVVRFGVLARKSLDYIEVSEIQDIRNQGSPRLVLVGKNGGKIGLWSNLLGYSDLVFGLKERCPYASYSIVERARGAR